MMSQSSVTPSQSSVTPSQSSVTMSLSSDMLSQSPVTGSPCDLMLSAEEGDSSSCCSLDDMPDPTTPIIRSAHGRRIHGNETDHPDGNTAQTDGQRLRSKSARSATSRHLQELSTRLSFRVDPQLQDEIDRFAEQKKQLTMSDAADETAWRDAIRQQLETDLDKRVRQALQTPPPSHEAPTEKAVTRGQRLKQTDLNAHLETELLQKERDLVKNKKWRALQAKRRYRRLLTSNGHVPYDENDDETSARLSQQMTTDDYMSMLGTALRDTHGQQSYYASLTQKATANFGNLKPTEKHEFYYAFTRNGFKDALNNGHLPDGSTLEKTNRGKYKDKYGIVRDEHGPFWPPDYGPLFPKPHHSRGEPKNEPLVYPQQDVNKRSIDNQTTPYTAKWRGVQIVFDSERSPKDVHPPSVSEGHCPSLLFESRFESGNLRQARRVGQFEYELVLKTDLYTQRHTQWYYFRVRNAQPNVTYKFMIVNLLKRDSLYNHGMRPLVYSEHNAKTRNVGWVRSGHHVQYMRNTSNLQCPVLQRDKAYYTLEWQMEFPHADDTYYLAHCYPYTFTDLRDDLDGLLADPERSRYLKREVMCETRAGNSCFLLTITNFDCQEKKKAVVVSARVHPGETNSSWMMKGLLNFITGPLPSAKELRNKFVFKVVPMLNPDGVIVGNYRCSLAGRDLNRNYRHPRKESFPTVWHIKDMMERLSKRGMEILVYCDFHGHSRKHNVFMYGCNTTGDAGVINGTTGGLNLTESYLRERLYPWLMSQKAPDKFCFRGCKFQIRKCKESTGRVVMFRQLQISNSFTMEATFCGTNICRGDDRHFNTHDFEHMGRVFAEVVLDYDQVVDNRSKLSDVALELTRAIAQQLLENTGVIPRNAPDFSTEAGREKLKEYSDTGEISTPEKLTAAFLSMVKCASLSMDKSRSDGQLNVHEKAGTDAALMEIENMVDNMSRQTMEGCIKLLEDLHVVERDESDSSDSDSESEPEMPLAHSSEPRRTRRKKKRNKKNKGRTSETREGEKSRGEVAVPVTKSESSLPAINSADPDTHRTKQKRTANDFMPSLRTKEESRRTCQPSQQTYSATKSMEDAKTPFVRSGNLGKLGKGLAKTYPGFVNKYIGRSNGGIPCFSEERLTERAAKRVEEMKKRYDEQQQSQNMFQPSGTDQEYWQMLAGYTAPPSHMTRSNTVTGMNYRSNKTSHSPGPQQIHTSYMHAEVQSPVGELHAKAAEFHPVQFSHADSMLSNESSSDESDDERSSKHQGSGVRAPQHASPFFTPAFLQPLPKRINSMGVLFGKTSGPMAGRRKPMLLPTMYHQQTVPVSEHGILSHRHSQPELTSLRNSQSEQFSSLAITALSENTPVNQPVSQPVNQPVNQPVSHNLSLPVSQPCSQNHNSTKNSNTPYRSKQVCSQTAQEKPTGAKHDSSNGVSISQPNQRQYTDLLLHHINSFQRPHQTLNQHRSTHVTSQRHSTCE